MCRTLVILGVCAVVIAAGCAPNDPVFSAVSPELPGDIREAGLEATTLSTDDAIPLNQAIAIASSEYGTRYEGASINAYLVELSVSDTAQGQPAIHDRPVWLIRYSGLSIPVSGPVSPEPDPGEEITVTHAYVVLNASNGVWLLTKETS